jgi:DNA-binding HxlR family transcriptional regulator
MARIEAEDTLCPLARAAAIVADRWTILILRELRLHNDRFDGIQAQTGMSSALLTQRLDSMERSGLIVRRLYQKRPERFFYVLTDKAHELDTMMLNLRLWGMRHCGLDSLQQSAVTMTHRKSGKVIGPDWLDPQTAGHGLFSLSEVDSKINPNWAAERAARAQAFLEAKKNRRAPAATRARDREGS